MVNRREVMVGGMGWALPWAVGAQQRGGKDALVLGMALEPTGLDPTVAAASAIGEVTLYNIYETLVKIQSDGSVLPLLAESWSISPDLKTYTFRLRKGVTFHNGQPFHAKTVKFTFERAASEKSTNKDKRVFAGMSAVQVVDDHTVVIINKDVDPHFLFLMGQATAVVVEPHSVADNVTRPVGTGPYTLASWNKGSNITLQAWPGHRNAQALRIQKVTFRFVSEPAAQMAALLAGDIQAFPRVSAGRNLQPFKNNPRFQLLVGGSRAKTIMAMNNAREPLNDVRVRRALAMAIDRKAAIQGMADGLGSPIGSYYVPGAEGYVDLTARNAFHPQAAQKLLAEAGVTTPLSLTMTVPPPPYARQGSEVLTQMLDKIGVKVKIQNVEWAQWLANTFGGTKDYDLTIISHVEPFDLDNFVKPNYYWGYKSGRFDPLYRKMLASEDAKTRIRFLGDIQRLLADESPHAFLYQPQWLTLAHKNLRGLWKDMPIFCNDVSALAWS